MKYSRIKETARGLALGRVNSLNGSQSPGFCSVQVVFTVSRHIPLAHQVCDLLFAMHASPCVLRGGRARR